MIFGIVISNVLYYATDFVLFKKTTSQPALVGETDNAKLTALACTVLGFIDTGDYLSLSRVAHPEFGVVFSPCATVSLNTNKCFQSEQIAAFGSDHTIYVWGVREGAGEPIEMTPQSYFAEYYLAKGYTGASIIGVNRIIKSGNALENITEMFPDVSFVDFHIPGGDRDATEDLNWKSLRLGFEEYEGKLWLTVILNSKWTV